MSTALQTAERTIQEQFEAEGLAGRRFPIVSPDGELVASLDDIAAAHSYSKHSGDTLCVALGPNHETFDLWLVKTRNDTTPFLSKRQAKAFSKAYGRGMGSPKGPKVQHVVAYIPGDLPEPADEPEDDEPVEAAEPQQKRPMRRLERIVTDIRSKVQAVAAKLPAGVTLEEPPTIGENPWSASIHFDLPDIDVDTTSDIADLVADALREVAAELEDAADKICPVFHQGRLAILNENLETVVLGPMIDGPLTLQLGVLSMGPNDEDATAGNRNGWTTKTA